MRLARGGTPRYIPIIDHTGITGKFDFHPDVATTPVPENGGDMEDNSSNISDAMKSQSGLQLNRTKVTLEVVVVDQANRAPPGN